MQVASRTSPRVSSQTEHFARIDRFPLIEKRSREVPIDCFKPIVVADNDIVAIPARVPPYDTHLPIPRSAYGVAYLHFDVGTIVEAVFTETELGSNISSQGVLPFGDRRIHHRHHKSAHIYLNTILQRINGCGIRIDPCGRPNMLIDTIRRVVYLCQFAHRGRQQLIQTFAIVGDDHQTPRQHILRTSDKECIAGDMRLQPFRNTYILHLYIIKRTGFIALAVFQIESICHNSWDSIHRGGIILLAHTACRS